MMPGQKMRKQSVRRKLNPIDIEFKGKNVLLVDDSIVRGTTSQQIIQMARDAGASKVYIASAAPPVTRALVRRKYCKQPVPILPTLQIRSYNRPSCSSWCT